MNLSNSELDQLFKEFREEEPVASFKETQKAFLTATVLAAGGVLATKSILNFFTFKQWIIMISILSTTTIGVLLVTLNTAPVTSEKKTETRKTNLKEMTLLPHEEESEVSKEKLKTFVTTLESLVPETKTNGCAASELLIKRIAYINGCDYHFVFVINQQTSKEDLEKLRKLAKAAGVDLVYTHVYRDELLKQLSLQIVQKEENGKETNILISDIDLEEESEYKVAWNVDEKGKATTIACGKGCKSGEVDELLAELDFIELKSDLASINELCQIEISGLGELVNLSHYQDELTMATEMLENEEVRAALLKLESVNQKDLEEMLAELADVQEDLEELELEMHEEHKTILDALVEDGLIKDTKKRIKMSASKGKIKVNGKEIPKKLQKKYTKLIQENFDVDVSKSGTTWDWSCLNR